MDAITTYKLFAQNSERTLMRIAQDPQISREIEYYRENIGKIESPEQLVNDFRLFNFALKAYGLEDLNYAKALMQELLLGGVDDEKALANQLTDPRYKEFASDFNFARYGDATTSFDRTQQGVVDRYLQNVLESEAGESNVGARLAIYFERKAPEIEETIEFLGDRALLQVIQTAFGLPPQMSFSPLERQTEIIEARLSVEDLSNQEFVKELSKRFLALWDLQNPNSASDTPLISTLAQSNQITSLDLLTSVQAFKTRT